MEVAARRAEKTTAFASAIVLCIALPLLADGYGSPSEMRGARKIFVDTGDDVQFREAVIERLSRNLPHDYTYVDDDESADVIFVVSKTSEGAKGSAIRLLEGGKRHIVWNHRARTRFRWEPGWFDVADKFADAIFDANR